MGPRFSRGAVFTAVAFFLWASGASAQTIVTNTNPASASGLISTTTSSSTGPGIYGLQGQTCTVDVIGTFTGTINVQGSTSWSNVPVSPIGSSSTQTGITAAGLYYESVASLSQIRVTGPTSTGSVNVFLYCVFNGLSGSSGTISGSVSATQSGTWNMGITGTLPGFATTPTFNCGTGCGGTSSFIPSTVPTLYATNATTCNPCSTPFTFVPLSAGKVSYLLSLTLNSSITQIVELEYGTGVTCANGGTPVVIGAFPVTAGSGIQLGYTVIPSGEGLCVVPGASGVIAVIATGFQQ